MSYPRETKNLTVQFFIINPLDGHESAFEAGKFPAQRMVDAVGVLDPASPEYRLPGNLFGSTEQFCHILPGEPPLICSYTKELVAAPETEHKGEIRALIFDEDEGVVDCAYLMLFPGDVVAILRTSNKAPGRSATARWLSTYGGVPFYLAPLPDPDFRTRLARGGHVRRVKLKARMSKLRTVGSENSFAESLRAIARPHSDVVEYSTSSTRPVQSTPLFSSAVVADLDELVALTPALEQAQVWVTGDPKPIDLKGAHHTTTVAVELDELRRVGPPQAAQALIDAFGKERPSPMQGRDG